MGDELVLTIREFIVEEVGEDMGHLMTLQAHELARRIRGVEYNASPASAVFTIHEQIAVLSATRTQLKKIERDKRRLETRYPGQEFPEIDRKERALKEAYKKLGGNPKRLNEWVQVHPGRRSREV